MRLTVLDLTRLLPGGYATHLLREMGARVIKVEDPGAGDYLRGFPFPLEDGMSVYFHAINRGKQSIVVDLKNSPDVFLELSRHVDVIIEGFRPGVMERLGAGYEEVAKKNNRIVYCSLSGYGSEGDYRDRPGHDVNYLSLSGLIDLQRGQDGRPAMPALQIADVASGSLFVVARILHAIVERSESGAGCRLDLSMLGGTASLMSFTASPAAMTGRKVCWADLLLNGQVACYNLYPTADDRWISVGNLEEKFWITFCEVLEKPGWIDRQFDRSVEFREEISLFLRSRKLDEWVHVFEGHDTCVEPVLTLGEAAERGIFKYPDLPAPKHGQHTEQVLRELLGPN